MKRIALEFGFNDYLSPFSWRYASDEMRSVFSERARRLNWRRVWVALARAQHKAGLVSRAELADIEAHAKQIDVARSLEIEEETRHDLVAELRAFAEQCKTGGGKIHLGATSYDVVDNADAIAVLQALAIVRKRLFDLLACFKKKIDYYACVPCIGFTHLQPAEPTTLGYRLAFYAQDLLADFEGASYWLENYKAKGFKGAVGTSASYAALLAETKMKSVEFEKLVLDELGLQAFEITTQTAPRKQDYRVLCFLAGVAQSLHKFAFDVRFLQTPAYGEWSEPFGERQVGSSAMPFKRNPVSCEKICSLARFVAALPAIAWSNAALSALERTLDDSANKRVFLPEAFLAVDEILVSGLKVLDGLVVDAKAVARNLEKYGDFAATEPLLIALVKRGANRQEMHEVLREHALRAWQAVQRGEKNPLKDSLAKDKRVAKFLRASEVERIMNAKTHVGDAAQRARDFSKLLGQKLVEAKKKEKA
ncbi:MAG: adenylosuccinate lyase [Candidatus Norongarragalinales archaeon]